MNIAILSIRKVTDLCIVVNLLLTITIIWISLLSRWWFVGTTTIWSDQVLANELIQEVLRLCSLILTPTGVVR